METIHVATKQKEYDIFIEHGLLKQLGKLISQVWSARKVLVITDSNVGPLYLSAVNDQLNGAGFQTTDITVPAGESSKSWDVLQQTIKACADSHLSRVDGIIALGGGVIGDLAGLTASLWLRGISFIQIPTSLLAQVDSSVGGKTAIDIDSGKNLVGSFYQPDLVVIDPDTLKTLSSRVTVEGYGEVVKCAAMNGGDFWDLIEQVQSADDILKNAVALIHHSISFKAKVVSQDEREGNLRCLLNFGHTIGHGVEFAAHGRLFHGEAVAVGTSQVCKQFERFGLTAKGTSAKVTAALQAVGLPLTDPVLGSPAMYAAMRHDKKVRGKQLTFVYLKKIGEPAFYPVNVDHLEDWLQLDQPSGK